MDLKTAITIISSEIETSLSSMKLGLHRTHTKLALREIESAVDKFIKIEDSYDKFIDADSMNNGMSSFVVEDDNVRSES